MASGRECLPTEEKKFFQIGVKKVERSFLHKPILKLKKEQNSYQLEKTVVLKNLDFL